MTGLEARLQVPRRSFLVDVDLAVPAGSVLAVLGPNGAGKTTALRALAGLVPVARGTVRLGGTVLDDPAHRVRVPPENRSVGLVYQDHLLFPHLSAQDNVAFGLRARGVDRRRARERAADVLTSMGLAEVVAQRPAQLSGGQSQRVALARALAPQPELLLLDEPLAALDAGSRGTVRSELRRHVASYDGVTVLVTHDPLDALVLADEVLVMEAGVAVQSGTPSEVARRPRTDYVARLMGLNLLVGELHGRTLHLDAGGRLQLPAGGDGPVHAAIRPSAITLFDRLPDHTSLRNVWKASVSSLEARGDTVRVAVAGPPDLVADVTTVAAAELHLTPGTPVWCGVKATDIDVYPR